MEKSRRNQMIENLILKLDYKKLKLSILQKDFKELKTIKLLKSIIYEESILDIIEIVEAGIEFSNHTPEELYTEELELIEEINELYQEINELDTEYFYFISTLSDSERLDFYRMTNIEQKEYRDSKTIITIKDATFKDRIYDTVTTVKRRQLEKNNKTKLGKIIDILKDK